MYHVSLLCSAELQSNGGTFSPFFTASLNKSSITSLTKSFHQFLSAKIKKKKKKFITANSIFIWWLVLQIKQSLFYLEFPLMTFWH